jgi:hypothetical protein
VNPNTYLAKHLQSTAHTFLSPTTCESFLSITRPQPHPYGKTGCKNFWKKSQIASHAILGILSLLHTLAHKEKPNAPILATMRYNLPVSFFVSVDIKTMLKKIVINRRIKQYQYQFLMFTRALITVCKLDIISVTSPEHANKHLVNIFWKIHFCECIFSTDMEEEKF